MSILSNLTRQIFSESARGKREFPDLATGVRMAISLARRVINPAVEFAALYSVVDDSRGLKMHPLQVSTDPTLDLFIIRLLAISSDFSSYVQNSCHFHLL